MAVRLLIFQVLENEMDLLGWKVEQLSNDYKFCALNEEGELERFIEEHTLPEYSEYIILYE